MNMNGGTGKSGAGSRVSASSIPANEEVYAILREWSMDLNETCQKLLVLGFNGEPGIIGIATENLVAVMAEDVGEKLSGDFDEGEDWESDEGRVESFDTASTGMVFAYILGGSAAMIGPMRWQQEIRFSGVPNS